jgi:hypothetical protein
MSDFRIIEGHIGMQDIAATSTTQNHPLGMIVRAKDIASTALGVGEFIYLKGVASTIVGSIVQYDDNFQTALDTSAVTGPAHPLAVAMSVNLATGYGWYQIGGLALAAKGTGTSFADGAGLGAAAGLAVAAATGTIIQGAVVRAVASAVSDTAPDLVGIAINRPHDPTDVS